MDALNWQANGMLLDKFFLIHYSVLRNSDNNHSEPISVFINEVHFKACSKYHCRSW